MLIDMNCIPAEVVMLIPMKQCLVADELKPSTLMDLHFETHLYLQANSDTYMWNQVSYTKNHYAKVGMSSPYNQRSYPKVSCPYQFYNGGICLKSINSCYITLIPRTIVQLMLEITDLYLFSIPQ